MKSITIKNIPEDVYANFRQLCDRQGESMSGFLQDWIRRLARSEEQRRNFDETWERHIKEMKLQKFDPITAAEDIRAEREERDERL
ncbi:MAG: hypothetical protein SFV18_15910 [Bryobacteraceae bacterium]|nr:hypothetical protein [Bryobacteraceae bacterium]